jgi:hypothetical protein
MAAGLGFKDFTTGEVLTAADVDGYLMQGVWVFASATARDAAVTSPQEGNFAYLKDTNVTTYYTGSAWANLDTTGMTNPMTTTGDTIYSSSGSTPARLGIGTAGQVLTVNSGATAPEWATASSGALVKINTYTFSGSSGQSMNDIFSATYRNYVIKATFDSTSVQTEIRARLRVSGSDNTSNNYRGSSLGTNSGMSSTTLTGDGTGTISYWSFNFLETAANDATSHMEIFNPFATAYTTFWNNAPRYRGSDSCIAYYTGTSTVTTSYTGLTIYPNTGTMTGKIEVYGYAI